MTTHSRGTVTAPFRLPAHLLPTATIVTAAGVPALLIHTPAAWATAATCATALIAIRSIRRAARQVDRILAEELAAGSTPERDSQLIH
ncbi:MAG TPA: hypothetical protein VM677_05195 [Actinokineospora sp.]|nr:hypothetical protein [Actinokineospora sp.]